MPTRAVRPREAASRVLRGKPPESVFLGQTPESVFVGQTLRSL
jgi:hypothetical protein